MEHDDLLSLVASLDLALCEQWQLEGVRFALVVWKQGDKRPTCSGSNEKDMDVVTSMLEQSLKCIEDSENEDQVGHA